jgi:DNA-binding transcriptional regulator YiaG
MSFLLEDMMVIKNTENALKEQEENLLEIKKRLEDIFESKEATISKEDFSKIFSKIEISFEKLENVTTNQGNSKLKYKIYETIYKNVKKIKEKYSDFLTNELINDLWQVEAYFGWEKQIYKLILFSEDIAEFNHNDIQKRMEKLYIAISSILQALENYSISATQQEIDVIQNLAKKLIAEISSSNHISVFKKILTTSKAILWEIEQQRKQPQNTVESLLNFLQTSPGWVGDDFEECLEYVNEVRKQ